MVATKKSLGLSSDCDKNLNADISAKVQPPIKNTKVIFCSCAGADNDELSDVFEFPYEIFY